MNCQILTKLQDSRPARVAGGAAVLFLSAVVLVSESAAAAGMALVLLTVAVAAFHGPALLVDLDDESE